MVSMQPCKWRLRLLLAALVYKNTHCMKHSFHAHRGKSLVGPVGVPFGFNDRGHFGLEVYDFGLSGASDEVLEGVEPGFILQKFENEAAFNQYMEKLNSNTSLCAFEYFLSSNDFNYDLDDQQYYNYDDVADPLFMEDDEFVDKGKIDSAEYGVFLSMKSRKSTWKPAHPKIDYSFKTEEAGFYFLIYQVCPSTPGIQSTFELDFHFDNHDSNGRENYLSVGEMKLPVLFFLFSISYLLCFFVWFTNIREIQQGKQGHFANPDEKQPSVFAIHQLMSLLLLLKLFSLLFESLRYHAMRIHGHAEVWSFVYYSVTFVKGSFLFTVILLIGTGWSFVKPFLHVREKRVIIGILILQLVNNLAIVVLSTEEEGEKGYAKWAGILHIVDILCCCAVLVPIVWQVNELEKTVGSEDDDISERDEALEIGEKGQILSKLKLFRSFYLVVVAYIYATRILVYLFATILDYKHTWVRYFVIETVTLTFYITVGLMFRPVAEVACPSVPNKDRTEEGVELLPSADSKKN